MKVPVIRTYSGLYVNPINPAPEDIRVQDIAHALANCNRFAGHLKKPISVAQHSVFVSRLCEPFGVHVAFQALFHDASEAYLGDVTKWLKESPTMSGYREAEHVVQTTVFCAMGMLVTPAMQHHRVNWADNLMVRFEGAKGFGKDWLPSGEPNPKYGPLTEAENSLIENWGFPNPGHHPVPAFGWVFWPWRKAEIEFLNQYWRLIRICDVVGGVVKPKRGEKKAARRILQSHNNRMNASTGDRW